MILNPKKKNLIACAKCM